MVEKNLEAESVNTLADKASVESTASRRSAYLFVLTHCEAPLDSSSRHCLAGTQTVKIGRGISGFQRPNGELRLAFEDSHMSSSHGTLTRITRDSWTLQDQGSRNGLKLNGFRIKESPLKDGDVFEAGRTFFLFRKNLPLVDQSPPDVHASALSPAYPALATLSPSLEIAFRRLTEIAKSSVAVLIHGETGAGKELIAQSLHSLSQRPSKLMALNCAAIPATLIESELFGYRRGAFSGATSDHEGLFQSANGGTLFLDEIGDLALPAQAKLLRALQEKQVVPLGSTQPIQVDMRICSATHQNLKRMIAKELFREDLLARLSGFVLHLPPLRERKEDLGILISNLLRRFPTGRHVRFQKSTVRVLLRQPWRYNIRQLEKCLEAAMVLAKDEPIGPQHLPSEYGGAFSESGEKLASDPEQEADERQAQLVKLMDEYEGNVSAVARAMGKQRIQIRRWMQKYNLSPSIFRRAR